MQIKFEGQSAIVTGAAHGFGWAVAQRLAELGARVWATDILERELSETARLAGENCRPHRLDVTDRDAVQALAKSVELRDRPHRHSGAQRGRRRGSGRQAPG